VIEQALHFLALQTITLTVAACAVRLLQATLARPFGAAARYVGWLLVPVAMVAVALPHPAGDALAIHVDVGRVAPAWATAASPAHAGAARRWAGAVMAVWAAGVLLLALSMLRRQRAFEALLSPAATGGTPRLPAGCGPAVLGLWRRRVVLPQDFESAFDAEERGLMLRHEGVHLQRADNAWNLLASVLLALHWFNPVAWWAWHRLHADQETSCDAAVLREESPAVLATYAGALLNVQGVALTPPLATSWQSSHPLVERVRMLPVHRISSARHRAGLRLAALSILLAGFGGYAIGSDGTAPGAPMAAGEPSVMTEVEIQEMSAGKASLDCKLLARLGQKVTVRFDSSDVVRNVLHAPIELQLTVTRRGDNQLQLETVLLRGNPAELLTVPQGLSLVTPDGTPARLEVKAADGRYDLALKFTPRVGDARVLAPEANDVRTPDARPGRPAPVAPLAS
jgi:beta-lactamase regulating signal transducer with metallopeptidase domain